MGKFRDFNNIPRWTATLGALREAKADIRAVCDRCEPSRYIDLNRMLAALGPTYTLWNKTPRCTRPGCDGRVFFSASLRSGWPVNMKDALPHEAEGLHHAHMEGYDYDAWKRQGGAAFDF